MTSDALHMIWKQNTKVPNGAVQTHQHTTTKKKNWVQKSREDDADFLFWQQKCNSPEGQTVNATFYIQVLDYLCKRIASVRPEIWRDRKFFLLHDNGYPHTAAIVQQFFDQKGVAQLSPDLSPSPPSRLFRFPKIKIVAKRWPLCFDRQH